MYGLSKHKGYITAAHSEALLKFGPSVVHRRSFSNIQALL
jgi:ribonuclease HII